MTGKSSIQLGDLYSALDPKEAPEFLASARSLNVNRISDLTHAVSGDLVFVASEPYLKAAAVSAASVFVVSESLQAALVEQLPKDKIVLRVKDVMLSMAKASVHFATELKQASGIHPSAIIHPSAKVGDGVSIGAGVVVEESAVIGKNSVLYPRSYVGARSTLGDSCVLFPGVVIYQDVTMGSNVRVHANSVIGADGFGYAPERTAHGATHVKIHHMGGVTIGNGVEIGASSTIDRGTVGNTLISNGCIIDNQVQIGHNCQLEEGVIVCGSTGIAGSVKVGKYAVIAGFVGIGNGAEIGAGAQIAGYTMVFGKVPAGIKWGGVPGRPLKETMRLQAMLGRLPEIYDDWKRRKKEL